MMRTRVTVKYFITCDSGELNRISEREANGKGRGTLLTSFGDNHNKSRNLDIYHLHQIIRYFILHDLTMEADSLVLLLLLKPFTSSECGLEWFRRLRLLLGID